MAECLHFGQTAKQHFMTTSTVTRLVQRLEADFAAPLFIRHQRKVMLTDQGKQFYHFAQESCQNLATLKRKLNEEDPQNVEGEITLIATVTAAYIFLPKMIQAFRKQYPKVLTYLETGNTQTCLEKLLKSEVDFAINVIPPNLPDNLEVQPLFKTSLVFIAPKTHKLKKWQNISMIFPKEGELATSISQYFESLKFKPNIHSFVDGHEAILAMVAAGVGGALIPQAVLENSHLKRQVKVITPPKVLPQLEVGLMMKKSGVLGPAKDGFWKFINKTKF